MLLKNDKSLSYAYYVTSPVFQGGSSSSHVSMGLLPSLVDSDGPRDEGHNFRTIGFVMNDYDKEKR